MLFKTFIATIIIFLLIFIYLVIYYLPTRTGAIASQKFEEWQKVYGKIKARQMTVEWLKRQLIVKDAGISEDGTIWMEFKNGTEANISTYPPEAL